MEPRQQIRPTVDTAPTAQTPAEIFQNETLRPILKMQHDLLLRIFLRILEKRKIKPSQLTPEQKDQQLKHSLSKDNKLRNLLLGAVIGQFTVAEYDAFLGLESEATRRIFTMLHQRLSGSW